MRICLSDLRIWNFGGEAIIRGTVEILSRVFDGEVHFDFPARDTAYTRARLADISDLTVVPHRPARAVLRYVLRKLGRPYYRVMRFSPSIVRDAGCVLSVGGDKYALTAGDIPWGTYGLGEYCYEHSIPHVIWGATIGPFEDRPERVPLMVEHLRKAALILARDNATVDYLAGKSVTENVKRVFDPAFLMPPEPFDAERFLPRDRRERLVGLNFSPLLGRFTRDPSAYRQEVVRTCEAVLREFDVSIVLIPHVCPPFRLESFDDLLLLRRVFEGIDEGLKDRVGIVSADIGARRSKHLISRCAFFAGARMHATIGAFSARVPTLSLAYSMKGRGLNQDIFGHQEWVLPSRELNAELFCRKLSELMAAGDEVRSALKAKIPEIQEQALMAGTYLKEVLDAASRR